MYDLQQEISDLHSVLHSISNPLKLLVKGEDFIFVHSNVLIDPN